MISSVDLLKNFLPSLPKPPRIVPGSFSECQADLPELKGCGNFVDAIYGYANNVDQKRASRESKKPESRDDQAKKGYPATKPGKTEQQRTTTSRDKQSSAPARTKPLVVSGENDKTAEDKLNEIIEMLDSEEISDDMLPNINILDIDKIDEFVELDNVVSIDVFDKNNPYPSNEIDGELDKYIVDMGPNEDYMDEDVDI